MKKSTPVRIDDELYRAATDAASTMSRSTAQQIAHWARIGRELEASDATSIRDVERVLAGETSYDSLGGAEQSIVRAEWQERMDRRRNTLHLDLQFEAAGQSYVELDEAGEVVVREPSQPDD